MGFKSAKKSNTTKTHSNGKYEVGGLLFPSYRLYSILKKINKNLCYFYTPGGEETDYDPIFDSPTRDSDDIFNARADKVEELIGLYKDMKDNPTSEFIYNNCKSFAFVGIFPAINYAFIEAIYMGKPKNDQQKRIRKIVRKLAYYGIELY